MLMVQVGNTKSATGLLKVAKRQHILQPRKLTTTVALIGLVLEIDDSGDNTFHQGEHDSLGE